MSLLPRFSSILDVVETSMSTDVPVVQMIEEPASGEDLGVATAESACG